MSQDHQTNQTVLRAEPLLLNLDPVDDTEKTVLLLYMNQ